METPAPLAKPVATTVAVVKTPISVSEPVATAVADMETPAQVAESLATPEIVVETSALVAEPVATPVISSVEMESPAAVGDLGAAIGLSDTYGDQSEVVPVAKIYPTRRDLNTTDVSLLAIAATLDAIADKLKDQRARNQEVLDRICEIENILGVSKQ
nr:calphotin-like [Drosophila virilis]